MATKIKKSSGVSALSETLRVIVVMICGSHGVRARKCKIRERRRRAVVLWSVAVVRRLSI
jgi:hypothetical protein